MAQCKAVDISKMPHNVLKDFLNGELSFQDALKWYPLENFDTTQDDKVEQDEKVITLSTRKQ